MNDEKAKQYNEIMEMVKSALENAHPKPSPDTQNFINDFGGKEDPRREHLFTTCKINLFFAPPSSTKGDSDRKK